MSAEPSKLGSKAPRGKFARKSFKRKANRAAAEAGIVPGSAEDNDPTKPWYKKPRSGGVLKDRSAQSDKDAEFDPARMGESKWKMGVEGGSFMVSAPDCPKFEEYYRQQGIIAEEEWPAFLTALRTKLPTTFRLSTINGMHYHLLHTLQNELQCTPEENQMGAATSYTYTDAQSKISSVIDPPAPLAWYPNSLGWYLKAGKSELKTRGNKFAQFRAFLMAQYDQGNLNRQEAVSMIPPLLLDVQPQHMVLDMCAAPGSKTAQLIEGLHGGIHYTDTFATPEGMVIANDADTKRAYLLVHQLKRYGSSAFLVTTHDGQQFPNIYRKDATAAPAAAASSSAAAAAPTSAASSTSAAAAASFNPHSTLYGSTLIEFDRILCDVPCSGDGTMRKNINLWSMWDTKFANGLHSLQIQIACRALEMLKVGGLMVYSTCSFNPIENESVVMELLRRCKGNLEIVDVADKLPGLIRRPGLTNWKVRDTGNDRWASADDEDIKAGTHKILKGSMFPPSAAEIASAHLERCMRVVPHSQDTGGFFIVLLRKTGETHGIKNPAAYAKAMEAAAANGAAAAPNASPDAAVVDEADAAAAAAAQSVLAELPELDGDAAPGSAEALAALPAGLDDPVGSKGHKQAVKAKPADKQKFNDDPFEPMNAAAVSKIIEFYGLAHGVDHSNFFTRSDVHRKCYFVAPGIASLLNCPRNAQRLKIVHTGARCYERGGKPEDATYPCQYRVVQEGVESILPFMTKQLLYPSFSEAVGVLYRHAWAFKDMDREGAHANLYRELTKNKNGCMVFVLRGSEIAKHTTGFSGGVGQVKQEGAAASSSSSASSASASAPVSLRSIPICIWKTPFSISLMVSAIEASALLKLLDPLETFMPPEVKQKRDEQLQKEEEKRRERQQKQQEYVNKAKEATAAAAAAAAAASPNVKVEAPAAPAAMDVESSPVAADASASSAAAVKMETS